MTVCDRGEGGSKIIKKSVTYFMDGPFRTLQNVMKTQKNDPCQPKKLSLLFPAGGFSPNTTSSSWSKAQSNTLQLYITLSTVCIPGSAVIKPTRN